MGRPRGQEPGAPGDRLTDYRRKRDPARTPEPFGEGAPGNAPVFVIHRHDATRLHYDLRLERDGALASWAVPKGLPLVVGEKHLAVRVEDHPMSYGDFEGEIPAGQYGAGTVEIWDRGHYDLVEDKADGGLTVRLHGAHLDGLWTLVPAAMGGEERNWLVIRKAGGTSMERGPLGPVAPMLATASDRLPGGEGWAYEIKWDGYRVIGRVAAGDAELWSRSGQSLTERFRPIARALVRAMRSPECVVDGEVCAVDAAGRPSFSTMQRGEGELRYFVFDLLEVEGESLLAHPLTERRARLAELVDDHRGIVVVSESFPDGPALLELATSHGLEGVVAKRTGSKYRPGARSDDWIKVKARRREEFPVLGYTRGKGGRVRLGSLVLGVERDGALHWAGNCGSGLGEGEIDRLLELLSGRLADEPRLDPVPRMPRISAKDVVWVAPGLLCEVEFSEWTDEGRLRAPVYHGVREGSAPPRQRSSRTASAELSDGGRVLQVANLDKVFWPEEGITKGDLLDYYRAVAPVLVPHLRDRPFTMRRYPDGIEGQSFFQKDAPDHMPEWIETFTVEATSRETREKRSIRAPLVNDALALAWMVAMGCIDMNAWYSRTDMPDRPDTVLFDLDPAEDVGFREVVQVALLVKEALGLLGLAGYPKTSGSKGMHVLVPIDRVHTYAETRRFSEVVAGALRRAHPGLVTTEWRKERRRGVLVDANQNGQGKTIASVYSVRPRPGAPVSTPLDWAEVVEDLDPVAFSMDVALDRVARRGDLFAPVLEGGQSLTDAFAALDS